MPERRVYLTPSKTCPKPRERGELQADSPLKQFRAAMKARLRARQGTSQYFRSCFLKTTLSDSRQRLYVPFPLRRKERLSISNLIKPFEQVPKCYIGGLGPFFLLFYGSQYGLTYLILTIAVGKIERSSIAMATAPDFFAVF